MRRAAFCLLLTTLAPLPALAADACRAAYERGFTEGVAAVNAQLGAVTAQMQRDVQAQVNAQLAALDAKRNAELEARLAAAQGEALAAQGAKADQVCAFARLHEGDTVIVAVPRLVARLEDDPDWGDTAVVLPTSVGAGRWRNLLTGAVIETQPREDGAAFPAGTLLGKFPFALLVPEA